MEIFAILSVSAAFVGLGAYVVWSYIKKLNRLRIEGSEVTATIVKISGMRKNRKAFISYTTAGNEYTIQLNYYSNGMKAGDTVKLYVNNNNPKDIIYVGKGPVVMGVLFVIIGAALPIVWQINL